MFQTLLRGITFAQLRESGVDPVLRKVQMLLPPGAEELIRTIPGFEDFNGQQECLEMLKQGLGLKEAPRLWFSVAKGPHQDRSKRCSC